MALFENGSTSLQQNSEGTLFIILKKYTVFCLLSAKVRARVEAKGTQSQESLIYGCQTMIRLKARE
jgi:hypothetical protein